MLTAPTLRVLSVLPIVWMLLGCHADNTPRRLEDKHWTEVKLEDYYYMPVSWITPSPDSRRIAYVAWRGGLRWQVVIRGAVDEYFDHFGNCSPYLHSLDGIACLGRGDSEPTYTYTGVLHPRTASDLPYTYLIFSPDSSRLAFLSRTENGYAVTVDGQKDNEFSQVWFGSFAFTANSQHFYYFAGRSERDYFVLDHKEHELTLGHDNKLMVSPDGRFAYRCDNGSDVRVVIDGESKKYEDVDLLTFSDKKEHLAYAAKRDGRWFVVHDGEEGKQYDGIKGITFSHNGDHLAFVAEVGKRAVVVRDGREGQPRDEVRDLLLFSPNEKHLAYCARKGEKWAVVVNEEERGVFDSVCPLSFSPRGNYGGLLFSSDSRRLAYIVGSARKAHVAVEEVEQGRAITLRERFRSWFSSTAYRVYDTIEPESLAFQPRSGEISYHARRESEYIAFVNGKDYRAGWTSRDSAVVFSTDGQRFGFFPGAGKVNIDGNESGNYYQFAGGGPVFSADGRHFAFAAQRRPESGGKWLV